MKRICRASAFVAFGFAAQAFALLLLHEPFSLSQAYSFSFAGLAFLVYRIAIDYRADEEMGGLRKELRRMWVRQRPENRISFAVIGGILLALCNPLLWQQHQMINIWAMGFVAVGLTQLCFELTRNALNRLNAFSLNVKKNKMEVKQSENAGSDIAEASSVSAAAYAD